MEVTCYRTLSLLSSSNSVTILNPSILKIYIDITNEEERKASVLTPLSLLSVNAVSEVNVSGDSA